MKIGLTTVFILSIAFLGGQAAADVTDSSHNETLDSRERSVGESSSPFQYACHERGQTEFRDNLKAVHARGRAAKKRRDQMKDFFVALTEHLILYANENFNMADNIDYCLSSDGKKENENCPNWRSWASTKLVRHVNRTRFHLSLSQSPMQYSFGMNAGISVKKSFNYNLKVPHDSHKEEPWTKTNKSERAKAKGIIHGYAKKLASDRGWNLKKLNYGKRKTLTNGMINLQNMHYKKYQELMSELPLMQYIHSHNPGSAEIQRAAQKVRDNANKEIRRLMDLRKKLKGLKFGGTIPREAFRLLEYTAFSEGLLLSNPEFCPIAAKALNNKNSMDFAKNVLIGTGLLAVGFFASPIVAVGVGVAAAIPLTLQAKQDYEKQKQYQLAQIAAKFEVDTGDPSVDNQNPFKGQSMKDIVAHRKNYSNEIIMAPTSLIGGGLLKRGYQAGKSLTTIQKATKAKPPKKNLKSHSGWFKLSRKRIRPGK